MLLLISSYDVSLYNLANIQSFLGNYMFYKELDGWMDGWMTCDFTSFSTVFQSYQDDERLVMKGSVQWSSVYD